MILSFTEHFYVSFIFIYLSLILAACGTLHLLLNIFVSFLLLFSFFLPLSLTLFPSFFYPISIDPFVGVGMQRPATPPQAALAVLDPVEVPPGMIATQSWMKGKMLGTLLFKSSPIGILVLFRILCFSYFILLYYFIRTFCYILF